jgi:hypothetical protein
MSTPADEYDEKIVKRGRHTMVLSSWSIKEIQQIHGCSEACAKLAKDMAEVEERRRKEEAEEQRRKEEAESLAQERREERDHALKLAELTAGTLCYKNAFIVMNFITILLLVLIRGHKQTTQRAIYCCFGTTRKDCATGIDEPDSHTFSCSPHCNHKSGRYG